VRSGGIITLSRDQAEVAELVRKGVLSKRQAEKHPRRNALTSALSSAGDHDVFEAEATTEVGDRLLLLREGKRESVGDPRNGRTRST
jgi:protein phosphatase